MAKFKLTPVAEHMDRPEWNYSSERVTVYVGATSESEARELVGTKFAGAGKLQRFAPMPTGIPWLNPELVSCEAVAEIAGNQMPHGLIYPEPNK